MIRKLFILLFLIGLVGSAKADVTVLSGIYQGKDLYVKNPFSAYGVGFCVFEVLVNGEVTSDEVNSSAFAIDLSVFGLEKGDPVEVVIRSKEGCTPYVINEDAIAPSSTYEVVSNKLQGTQLMWTTKGESGSLAFVLEQFKWNKWVEVGAVDGTGNAEGANYSVEVPTHAGKNIFRLKQVDSNGVNYSDSMEYEVETSRVELMETKVFEEIRFSSSTPYELYDEYGVLVAEGAADRLNVAELPSGRYFLNFSDQFGQVVIKK